jgi:spore coat protein A, manganese oxidase
MTRFTALGGRWARTLPKPIVLRSTRTGHDGVAELDVYMRQVQHSFHASVGPVPVWTYAANRRQATARPLVIEAQVGTPLRVTWHNDLLIPSVAGEPERPARLTDVLVMGFRQGMEEAHMLGTSHTQVHLHGARVPWTSDGQPMWVFHSREARSHYYPNGQASSTLWFHDHGMDVTRLNVYAGLFGMYLLRDHRAGATESAALPSGEFELPIILGDKRFDRSDGGTFRLRYEQDIEFFDGLDDPNTPKCTPEFLGDYPVANGVVWPKVAVKPTVYRLRIVNGANTRYFNLQLTAADDPTDSLPFHVIGSDGGFLEAPCTIGGDNNPQALLLAPGERADVLVNFKGRTGRRFVLRNDAPIPFPDGDPVSNECSELLRFDVSGPTVVDSNFVVGPGGLVLPDRVDPEPGGDLTGLGATAAAALTALDGQFGDPNIVVDTVDGEACNVGAGVVFRRFVLREIPREMPTLVGVLAPPAGAASNTTGVGTLGNVTSPSVVINGVSGDVARRLEITRDAYEVWEFINLSPDSHPMHVHLVQFKVLDRRLVDIDVNGLRSYGAPQVVEPYEQGWKDTVRCNRGEATRLLMRFDGFSGEYVYHCHILEHEDMGMMYSFNVERPEPQPQATP